MATADHHLRHLLTASLNILTGISIHNDRADDRGDQPIEGPVVSAFTDAVHKARLFLAKDSGGDA